MSGVTAASRIVVKIGSSSLTREDGGLDVYEKVRTVRDDLDAAPRTPLQYEIGRAHV